MTAPTFNRRDRLAELMANLEGQTITSPLNIVVVDDGGSVEISDVIAATGRHPVRLLRRPNGGPGAARSGCSAAVWSECSDSSTNPDGWLTVTWFEGDPSGPSPFAPSSPPSADRAHTANSGGAVLLVLPVVVPGTQPRCSSGR